MIKYKRFQFGWVIVITFLIISLLITVAYLFKWGNNPIDKAGYIFFMILLIGILPVLYGMTIIVTDRQLKIKFGIGFYTKKIDLSTIGSVSIQKYPIYFGYGIRILPNGLLYNVSGRHAVEIRFKKKKNVIQIGTDDWDNLREAIEKSINKSKVPGLNI